MLTNFSVLGTSKHDSLQYDMQPLHGKLCTTILDKR